MNLTFQVAVFAFGGILFLLGLLGQIIFKDVVSIGTNNKIARGIAIIMGIIFIFISFTNLSFNLEILGNEKKQKTANSSFNNISQQQPNLKDLSQTPIVPEFEELEERNKIAKILLSKGGDKDLETDGGVIKVGEIFYSNSIYPINMVTVDSRILPYEMYGFPPKCFVHIGGKLEVLGLSKENKLALLKYSEPDYSTFNVFILSKARSFYGQSGDDDYMSYIINKVKNDGEYAGFDSNDDYYRGGGYLMSFVENYLAKGMCQSNDLLLHSL